SRPPSRVCATVCPRPPARCSPPSARSWPGPARAGSTAAAAQWRWRRDSSTSVGDGLVLQLLLLVALIIGSGLLSGAEAAYFPLGRARLRRIAAERPEGVPAPVGSRLHDLLVTLLVGITVIKIGVSALDTRVARSVY